MANNDSSTEIMDIAIVGGGVSGVYSAYRLLTSDLQGAPELAELAKGRPNGRLRVGVFESSSHIGAGSSLRSPPTCPT